MKSLDVEFDNGTIKDVFRINPVINELDEKALTSLIAEFAGGTTFELRTFNKVKLGVRDLSKIKNGDQPIQVKLTQAGD